ncbi:MAG: serine hydrolase domain-containing protein [Anaerolineae bacterium]
MIESKRRSRRYGWILLALFLALIASWLWSSSPDTVYRMIRYNVTGVDDFRIFPSRPLKASQTPFRFMDGKDEARVPLTVPFGENEDISLDELLHSNDTLAFLVIKGNSILYEQYFNGHSPSSISLSFSIAKSILSILVGCTIEDGYIQSVDQPVTDFVPELASTGFADVTIEHLLQMTSGMKYAENDNPFGIHPRLYYTANLEHELVKLDLREPPGQEFNYKSGDTALLGLILSRALDPQTITEYMQDRLWEPLGMEFDGLWNIDHEGDGLEKTWCCIGATARDFAKFGRLYLNYGNWDGNQVVSRSWVERSTRVDTTAGSVWNYQYQWWLVSREAGDYNANGHLGQYLYLHPENDLIIVRLGNSSGSLVRQDWLALFQFLAAESK